jgi:hypothetical protein
MKSGYCGKGRQNFTSSFQCFVSMTFINKYQGCCWSKREKARQKDETSCKFVEDGPSRRKETGSY